MNNEIEYEYKLSSSAIAVTIKLLIFLAAILFIPLKEWNLLLKIVFLFLLPSILFMPFLPVCLQIKDEGITIQKIIGCKKISYKNIEQITQILHNSDYNFRLLPIFGNMGFFGYSGWFWHEDFKCLYLFASSLKRNLAFIKLKNGKKYIINCPGYLVDVIGNKLNHSIFSRNRELI